MMLQIDDGYQTRYEGPRKMFDLFKEAYSATFGEPVMSRILKQIDDGKGHPLRLDQLGRGIRHTRERLLGRESKSDIRIRFVNKLIDGYAFAYTIVANNEGVFVTNVELTSRYPSGLEFINLDDLQAEIARHAIERAVSVERLVEKASPELAKKSIKQCSTEKRVLPATLPLSFHNQ